MSYYYESHVTIKPVFDQGRVALLKELCETNEFRIADLFMQKRAEDTPERSKFDTFCSGRDTDLASLTTRMLSLVTSCRAMGFTVWRYKIEDVILDSKIDDSMLPLK